MIPVEGFRLDAEFRIGPVLLHTPDAAAELFVVDALPRSEMVGDFLAKPPGWDRAFAEVSATSIDEAVRLVDAALSVFRVFQMLNTRAAHNLMFGLDGQVTRSVIRYGQLGSPNRVGGAMDGELLGFELDPELRSNWVESATFQFLANSVGVGSPTEGQRRALIGARLLSRAVLERVPDMRYMLNVIALESMLLDRQRRSQTYRLARRLAYLACGPNDGCMQTLGHACPMLELDPRSRSDRIALGELVELCRRNVQWRCSRWLDVFDWYDVRSEVAHIGEAHVTDREARNIGHWSRLMYAAPTFDWLAAHQDDPIAELDSAINSLPSGGHDWLSAIRSEQSPTVE